MAWQGHKIKNEFLLLDESDAKIFNLSKSMFGRYEHTSEYCSGECIPVTTFWWFPEIRPAIRPHKELRYAVKMETSGTEGEIFQQGSFAGMETTYQCEVLSCRVNAPPGFVFHLVQLRRTRRSRKQLELKSACTHTFT